MYGEVAPMSKHQHDMKFYRCGVEVQRQAFKFDGDEWPRSGSRSFYLTEDNLTCWLHKRLGGPRRVLGRGARERESCT
jgi:hypothetical protein